jgi:SAM-dependent methyltransferase
VAYWLRELASGKADTMELITPTEKSVLHFTCAAAALSDWLYSPAALASGIARKNAKGVSEIKFLQAGFLDVYPKLKDRFDAVICLGNSLPHLLSKKDLRKTLQNIFNLLNPGGIFILQNRNYDRILKKRIRFMAPNITETKDGKVVFFRLLDFLKDKVVFNLVTFRQKEGKWSFQTKSTLLRPILRKEIENLLIGQGFKEQKFYGDYNFSPFERHNSEDLIVFARK